MTHLYYKKTISSERIPVFDFEGKQHIDFKNMAEQINDVNIKFVERRTIRLNKKPEVTGEVTEMTGEMTGRCWRLYSCLYFHCNF